MNWTAVSWLVLLVACLIVEASTVTMVSLWFAAGALAAMIVSLVHGALWLQWLIFVAVSGTMLALLRPLARKYFTPRLTRTNVDSVIGSTGVVTASIDNITAAGQVKLGGMEWSARSTSGDPISAGTIVRVDKIEGVKAFVTPVKETVEC